MEFLLLLCGFAALLGALLGWFTKGGFWKMALWSAIGTLCFGATVNLVVAGPPSSFTVDYLATGAIYFFFAWFRFLFLPCLVAAGLVFFIKRWRKRE